MKLWTCLVLSCVFSQAAGAQLIPPGLPDDIVSLTTSIGALQVILNTTNKNVEAFSPQFLSIGNQVNANLNTLSSSANNIYRLGSSNMLQIQNSLAQASNALVVLANFSTTVQNNVTPIALASVGVLAAGIVLGSFAVIGIKQAFFAIRGCWRLRHAPEIFLPGV